MCVLCYKPNGVKMPSKEILKACFKANPDGCGLVTDNGLYFRSLSFNDFYKVAKQIPKDAKCIFHFRWATHGSVKESNCHPFVKDGVFFAHNGVLGQIPTYGDKTDSEICFTDYLRPAISMGGGSIKHNHYFDYVCNELKGFSKFAFMQDGKVRLFGKFEKVKGVYYSNLRWLNYYRPAYYELFTDSHNAKQAMYEELFA